MELGVALGDVLGVVLGAEDGLKLDWALGKSLGAEDGLVLG